jgi:hypothetical protein
MDLAPPEAGDPPAPPPAPRRAPLRPASRGRAAAAAGVAAPPLKCAAARGAPRARRAALVERWTRASAAPPTGREARRRRVREALALFSTLPAASQYARHRLRVLRTALALLEAPAPPPEAGTAQEAELDRLLATLKL